MNPLVDTSIEISLILLCALASTSLLRRRSAALRHFVLAAALICAALAPAVARVAPVWHMEFPRTERSVAAARTDATVAPQTSIRPAVRAMSTGSVAAARVSIDLPSVLRDVWLAGIMFSLSVLLVGLGRLAFLVSRAKLLEDTGWQASLVAIAREYRISRPVRLLESAHPSAPVTWGVRSPTIILPHGAGAWASDRVDIVLRHELAHIGRYDWPIQIVAELVRSAYWFNPLAWVAAARIRRESEHACDDAVLGAGVPASDYASHLLDLARTARTDRCPRLPAQAIVRPSNLERRITVMLNKDINRRPISRSARFLAAGALVGVTVLAAGFRALDQGPTVVSGTVVDAVGRGMANATIVLTNVTTHAKHEVRSDGAGRFEFVPLPAGDYLLQADFTGFAPFRQPLTLSGDAMTRAISMQLDSIVEHIRISDADSSALPKVVAGPLPEVTPMPANWEELRDRVRAKRAVDPCAQQPEGGCIMAPVKVRDVKPRFPLSLKGSKIDENVVLKGIVGVDGSLRDLQVVGSPHPDLVAAAMDAVSQWQFEPTRLDGVVVDTSITITVNFAGR